MKINIVENTKSMKFENVEIRKPMVDDVTKAERISGQIEGMEFMAALISLTGKFDGKELVPEDVAMMEASDFLELAIVVGKMLKGLPTVSSISQELPDSALNQ
ncbi:MAG: hypothetical protein HY817_01565 [Candidatus Abawacabacteria bacterium]|nr:hypothetical protein [Candidatus Abawacabacteria bacterium]